MEYLHWAHFTLGHLTVFSIIILVSLILSPGSRVPTLSSWIRILICISALSSWSWTENANDTLALAFGTSHQKWAGESVSIKNSVWNISPWLILTWANNPCLWSGFITASVDNANDPKCQLATWEWLQGAVDVLGKWSLVSENNCDVGGGEEGRGWCIMWGEYYAALPDITIHAHLERLGRLVINGNYKYLRLARIFKLQFLLYLT